MARTILNGGLSIGLAHSLQTRETARRPAKIRILSCTRPRRESPSSLLSSGFEGHRRGPARAKRSCTVEDHGEATAGVECPKDAGVIGETPAAYKPIDAVMAAQTDLVEAVHTLKQVACVKG